MILYQYHIIIFVEICDEAVLSKRSQYYHNFKNNEVDVAENERSRKSKVNEELTFGVTHQTMSHCLKPLRNI